MNYTQLTQGQRYQIYVLLKTGHMQTEIAAAIGKDKSRVATQPRKAWLSTKTGGSRVCLTGPMRSKGTNR
ncbi:MAG: helix-turn-helix domain-containing protein [Anaerolineae bacterium]|nr:helix-turn-helix domain-containing protein [Anaerolineae bacterium]